MSTQAAFAVSEESSGLRCWMERVLTEAESVAIEFAPDPVHDLRVALRRCRSLARGYMAIDPDKTWKSMAKEGRRVFKSLGELRDVQVMERWVSSHADPHDPFSGIMLSHLAKQEQGLKLAAVDALREFNIEKWRRWIRRLQRRAGRLPPGGAVFQLSALNAYEEARSLHRQALRNRSARSYHRLRIGLKKFRYLVENFIPLRHKEWGPDLKKLQDCLGEIHDLTVLWETATRLRAFADTESSASWRRRIEEEKEVRLEYYRNRMMGDESLWIVWRRGLPPLHRLQSLGLAMIQKWACLRGVDLKQVRDVRRVALRLYDGLYPKRRTDPSSRSGRTALHLAAILQGLDRSAHGGNGHESLDGLLHRLPPAPWFSPELLNLAAAVAQCSRSKFRKLEKNHLGEIKGEEHGNVGELAGILRLAATLAGNTDGPIRDLSVERTPESIIIRIENYSELGPLAEKAARARYLLEYSCRQPVLIRGVSPAATSLPDSKRIGLGL
jgi:CHAD domain-containing protein